MNGAKRATVAGLTESIAAKRVISDLAAGENKGKQTVLALLRCSLRS